MRKGLERGRTQVYRRYVIALATRGFCSGDAVTALVMAKSSSKAVSESFIVLIIDEVVMRGEVAV